MDTRVAREMLRVIRAQRDSISARLETVDPQFVADLWLIEEPFINDLCLTLLVAVRHHVERELVCTAALATSDCRPLDPEQYLQNVKEERDHLRPRTRAKKAWKRIIEKLLQVFAKLTRGDRGQEKKGWKRISDKLRLEEFGEWNTSMNTLRYLANSYKHNPFSEPDKDLLRHLGLTLGANYCPLAESSAVREALARKLGLPNGADYCDITEELLSRVDSFLKEVVRNSNLSTVKRKVLSPRSDSFCR